MRHLPLKYKENNVPPILLNPGCKRKIKRAVDNENGNIFDGYYYKNNEVVDKLRAFSLHESKLEKLDSPKCYYCESKIEHAAKLQVEHYRPKAKVDKKDTNGEEHKGYFWLGCEWTNLLLSCPACNGKNAKGNRFPIFDNRAMTHNSVNFNNELDRTKCVANNSPLITENPVLINPEIDKPEEHFTFNSNAEILGITNRARQTIDILDLNRGKLKEYRQQLFSDILENIKVLFQGYNKNKINDESLEYLLQYQCKEIIAKQEPNQEYSLWAKCFNDYFEKHIDSYNYLSSYKSKIINTFNKISNNAT